MPRTIKIQEIDLLKINELRKSFCLGSRSAFSTNEKGEIWAFVAYGPTPAHKKVFLQGKSDLLDRIAGMYNELSRDAKKVSGGRFFIEQDRVVWKDSCTVKHAI